MSDDGPTKNRGGRPAERDEPKRAPINMRTTPTIRAALQVAADEAGRSLAQEIEQRLERSLILEDELGGPAGIELFRAIAASVKAVGGFNGSWRSDHIEFVKVYTAITRQIQAAQPIPKELWAPMQELVSAFESEDEKRKIDAAEGIKEAIKNIRHVRTKAKEEVDLIIDAMTGITDDDREYGEIAMQAIDRMTASRR